MNKQRKKKHYADCDCWGMVYWFNDTFVQMIRRLRDMKHGAPQQPFEEVDNFPLQWVAKESEILLEQNRKEGYEEEVDLWGKESYFDRWWLVLSRIAYCLEQTDEDKTDIKNEYAEEYYNQTFGKDDGNEDFKTWWNKHHKVVEYDEKGKPKLWQLITHDAEKELEDNFKRREEEIAQYREDMKNEAFDLLKKYFWNLWD
jgi:hypothetical protein